jgi:membrane-associated phospholipid phosphatase
MTAPSSRRRRAWWAVAGGTVVLVVAYLVGVVTAAGRHGDGHVARLAERAGREVRAPVHALLEWAAIPVGVVVTAVVVVAALRAGRRPDAVRAAALVVGAEVLTQVVKALLPRPGGMNTLPSGHVTFVAAVAVVVAMAAPAARRRLVAVTGAVVVLLAALGTWVIGWHRPSDVVAAVGVVAVCWGAAELLAPRPPAPEQDAAAATGAVR